MSNMVMNRLALGRTFGAVMALLFASTAAGSVQPVPQTTAHDSANSAPPADGIVVSGQLSDRATIDHEAKTFERQVQATPVAGQLARWHRPICPVVGGIDQGYADYVATRIRHVATRAGIAVAGDGCKPNLFVDFTLNGAGLVAAIERHDPRTLHRETLEERATLRKSDLPIRWWYATELGGGDGEQFDEGSTNNSYSASLIDTKVVAAITGAAVIIDAPRATGYRLDAVADYAAFVALGHFRVGARPTETPSILGLFARSPGDGATLTSWDSAYLSALYATQPTRADYTQRNRIAGKMVHALAQQ